MSFDHLLRTKIKLENPNFRCLKPDSCDRTYYLLTLFLLNLDGNTALGSIHSVCFSDHTCHFNSSTLQYTNSFALDFRKRHSNGPHTQSHHFAVAPCSSRMTINSAALHKRTCLVSYEAHLRWGKTWNTLANEFVWFCILEVVDSVKPSKQVQPLELCSASYLLKTTLNIASIYKPTSHIL